MKSILLFTHNKREKCQTNFDIVKKEIGYDEEKE